VGIFAEEIVTTDKLGRRTGPRTQHTIVEKLRIVQETRARGSSVATVVLRGRNDGLVYTCASFCRRSIVKTENRGLKAAMPQRVLITAGASGIGFEFVRAFAAAGAKVFTCDINADALHGLKDVCEVDTVVCDISSRDQIEVMVAHAVTKLGGIDVLINNAGIGGPTAPVQDMDPDEWDKVLRVDLTGPFNVTRNAIPHLIASGNGVIINMSSAAGRLGYPNRSPYAAAKWGLIGFTKTLSMELGKHNIRVNAIAPGAVNGDRIERVFEGRAKATGQSIEDVRRIEMANQSIKRLIDPRDIAALAVFLASDAAKSISGQVLPIDGDLQRF